MTQKLKKLIILMLAVIAAAAVFTLPACAVSLSYSGGSVSNYTGATGTTSGYTISIIDPVYGNVCGYRFSVVASSGEYKSGTKAVNIYLDSTNYGSLAYSSGQRFIVSNGVVANKKKLASGTKVSSTTARQSCDYKASAVGFYSALPQNTASVGGWIKNTAGNYQNLQRIYAVCGSSLASASESDYVLIEPILWVKLANVKTAATATELAIYGAAVSGGVGYNGSNGNLKNTGSSTMWNLQNYVNREFPNLLYVSSNTGVYSAVSPISTGRYTYKTIINSGLGCSVLTVKNVYTIPKYNNTISHWAWGFNGNGNNGNKQAFFLKKTTYSKKYGDTFKLNSSNAVTVPNGFYLENSYGSSSITGTWREFSFDYTITQKTSPIAVEYDYYPITYNITYDMQGGENNPSNPHTYNVLYGVTLKEPVKEDCEFAGWMQRVNKGTLNLSSSSSNWNYSNIQYGLKPGIEYEVSISNARKTAGSSAGFSCVIYDFTDDKPLAQKNVSYGDNIIFSLVCPSSADPSHDIRLIIYSGIRGSTSGTGSQFTDVRIEFESDGINKGCNSVFDSPDDLYSKLSRRTTGDVEFVAKWNSTSRIVIVPIEPNADYRENTTVITSFWLVNAYEYNYTPSSGALVAFGVYNSDGEEIISESKSFVVPKLEKNLVFFRWKVPDGCADSRVTVKAHIVEGNNKYGYVERNYTVAPFAMYSTPDTGYNAKAPDRFSVPPCPEDNTERGIWWQWEYENGEYIKKNYAVQSAVENLTVTAPTSPSAFIRNNILNIKSGYGFECNFIAELFNVEGYDTGSADYCTASQYSYALFPEYNYSYGNNLCRSFEKVSGKNLFAETEDTDRMHFTPVYYPDGDYNFSIVSSDCWTPAGMIRTFKKAVVKINGNMYEDWFVGRK